MAIEVTVHVNGAKDSGRVYTTRDSDHADRLTARLKAQVPAGSSTYFTRKTI